MLTYLAAMALYEEDDDAAPSMNDPQSAGGWILIAINASCFIFFIVFMIKSVGDIAGDVGTMAQKPPTTLWDGEEDEACAAAAGNKEKLEGERLLFN